MANLFLVWKVLLNPTDREREKVRFNKENARYQVTNIRSSRSDNTVNFFLLFFQSNMSSFLGLAAQCNDVWTAPLSSSHCSYGTAIPDLRHLSYFFLLSSLQRVFWACFNLKTVIQWDTYKVYFATSLSSTFFSIFFYWLSCNIIFIFLLKILYKLITH